MEKKPQFNFDQLYIPIFGSKRVYQPDGHCTWEKIPNQSAITGITILDEFLHQVHSGNGNMKSIALSAGVSVRDLSVFIRLLTGMQTIEFYHRYSLLKSVDLLRYTSLTCGEIARLCGYRNLSNFSSSFSLYYKARPSRYRKLHRESGDLNRYKL